MEAVGPRRLLKTGAASCGHSKTGSAYTTRNGNNNMDNYVNRGTGVRAGGGLLAWARWHAACQRASWRPNEDSENFKT